LTGSIYTGFDEVITYGLLLYVVVVVVVVIWVCGDVVIWVCGEASFLMLMLGYLRIC